MTVDPRALESAAQRLRVDGWASEVVGALRAQGIKPILLKGPAIARWLYAEDRAERPYGDVDLLVSPADQARTSDVLLALGFETQAVPLPAGDEPHATAFLRPSDRAAVDLHRVLHGMEGVSPDRVWQAVHTDAETLWIGDVAIAIPNEIVRTMHLVLHKSPRDGPGSKAWRDLLRGLELIDPETWDAAARLARMLGIENEVGHRLSHVPEAAPLLARLELPQGETKLYAIQRIAGLGEHSPGVISLLMLAAQPDSRARAAYIRAKLFPPAAVLRARYPLARRGHGGLALSRIRRLGSCLVRLPAATLDWSRQRLRAHGR